MAMFITRVELQRANEQDYQVLQSAMDGANFSRTVTADDGETYQLPTAEYVSYSSTLSAREVHDLAKRAADETGRESWVFTSESVACAFQLRQVSRNPASAS